MLYMCLESQPQAPSGSGDSTSPCLKGSFSLGFFWFLCIMPFFGVFKLCGTKPKTIFKFCNAAGTEPAWPFQGLFQGPRGLSSLLSGRRVSRFFAPKPRSESPFQRVGLFCLGLLMTRVLRLTPNLPAPYFFTRVQGF